MPIELNKEEMTTLATATGLLPTIKMVRDRTGCSLSEAKHACELVRAHAYQGSPEGKADTLLTVYVNHLISNVCEETGISTATAWRLLVKVAARRL